MGKPGRTSFLVVVGICAISFLSYNAGRMDLLNSSTNFIFIPRNDSTGKLNVTTGNGVKLSYILHGTTPSGSSSSNISTFTTQNKTVTSPIAENICPNWKATSKPKRLKVFLMTSYRSGSSFVGELFNKNPKIFYMFEPLRFVQLPISKEKREKNLTLYNSFTTTKAGKYVEDGLNCEFSSLLGDSDRYFGKSSEKAHWMSRCFTRAMGVARSGGPEKIKRSCKGYNIVATKIIRLALLNYTVPQLFRDPDLKIVHLVRDPRGTISSRSKIEKREKMIVKSMNDSEIMVKQFENSVGDHCDKLSINVQFLDSIQNQTPCFKYRNNYLLVRYEDFALDATGMAKRLYGFLGVDISSSVLMWIKRGTQAPRPGGTYSTVRNSKATAEAWREHLPFDFVKRMQTRCGEVLTRLGYKHVSTPQELNDRKAFSTVGKFPSDLPGLF